MSAAPLGGTVEPSEAHPFYRRVIDSKPTNATTTYMVVCNEGWRESIVCQAVYGWAADWLVDVLQGRPYPTPWSGRGRDDG